MWPRKQMELCHKQVGKFGYGNYKDVSEQGQGLGIEQLPGCGAV